MRNIGQFDRDPPASVGRLLRRAVRRNGSVNLARLLFAAAVTADRRSVVRFREDEADLFVLKTTDREEEAQIGFGVARKIERRKSLVGKIRKLARRFVCFAA